MHSQATTPTAPDNDRLFRFLFEKLDLRGEFVRLDTSWKAVLHRNPCPDTVADQLGEAVAAANLLAATLKFEGSLILQVQSSGPIRTLVAQADHDRTFRGIARWEGEVNRGSLGEMFGNGHMVLTIAPKRGERFQGVVGLEGERLNAVVGEYFARSEQLSTRLWLAADQQHAAGLLIQALPGKEREHEDWNRIESLSATVTDEELLTLPVEELLFRLFHEEQVRLFEPEPLAFRCNCSRERITTTLQALGQHEVEAILAEQGLVEANCEFCGKRYAFDAVDVAELFKGDPATSPSTPPQ